MRATAHITMMGYRESEDEVGIGRFEIFGKARAWSGGARYSWSDVLRILTC